MANSHTNTAYGVTKPVGFVIVSFPTENDARAAIPELRSAGFADQDVRYYSPEQMRAQADADIANAGILATIGQELNLVRAHRDLAEAGHAFLSVRAPQEEQARQVADIARHHGADRAQKYGRLIIEELIEPGTGERQVAESPDRGLDPQTQTGTESDEAVIRPAMSGSPR
jgi:hypothetical protein